jgi:hypothetical protein
MKKYFIALSLIAMLTGCVTTKLPEPYSYSSIIDYSALTEQGYFVTESNSVSFEYQGIGSVFATSVGGWTKKTTTKKRTDHDSGMYYSATESTTTKYYYVHPDINEAFNKLSRKLKELNADGIINLRFEFYGNGQDSQSKIAVTGMAIKRL